MAVTTEQGTTTRLDTVRYNDIYLRSERDLQEKKDRKIISYSGKLNIKRKETHCFPNL